MPLVLAHVLRLAFATALAHAICAGSTLAGDVKDAARAPAQSAIDAAIERGTKQLVELYADGEGRARDAAPPNGPGAARDFSAPQFSLVDCPGLRAFTVYTLVECGVDAHHPVVERLLAHLAFERWERTYDVACLLLALAALDDPALDPWTDELAAQLAAWQTSRGDWGYPERGDLSNTQFAALALHAAAGRGARVPASVWSRLAPALLGYATTGGGFSYAFGDRRATGSMTTAGVSTLALCELELARADALPNELAHKLRDARRAGIAWLAQRFTVERNPESTQWTDAYLWGLERVGALAGVRTFGTHDWYAEGARELLKTQTSAGDWPGTFERVPTLFALLFLRRATAVERDARTFDPAAPLPVATGETGEIVLAATGTSPLRVSIAAWPALAVRTLEWPGEAGAGPRVVRVDYAADGAVIASALGDPSQPARARTFAATTTALGPGAHLLTARVHVRAPDETLRVLGSAPLALEIAEHALPPRVRNALVQRVNLLADARADVKASSVLRAPAEWNTHGFDARRAVDGNARSPWIAAASDVAPELRITLKRPVRADRVRVELAQLVPRSPAFLGWPREIALRVNDGPERVLAISGNVAVFTLERTAVVKSLTITLRSPDPAGTALGIGEVELALAAQ